MNRTHVPYWVSGDWNAFFGLFTNILANILVAAGLLVFVVKIPANVVYGQIVPAMGIAIFAGNIYYAYMARRKALRGDMSAATALPYGPSVGHLFVVTFLIIFPVFRATGNAMTAWQVGVAWCIVESLTEVAGAYIGPWVRRVTPRAAMLAVMAGIAITLIAMNPMMRTWEAPYIGMISLAFVLVAWVGRKPLPYNFPAGLAMLLFGTAVAWIGTWLGWIPAAAAMNAGAVSKAWAGLTFTFPSLNVSWEGFRQLAPYLVTAIPLGIGGFLNTMDNVESAAAAGDEYDTREAMLADAGGSLLGALFGSPFATGVYVGHPGWKAMGAGMGYAAASGIGILLVTLLGVVSLFQTIIPLVAILPILLYIGMVMGAQAFQAVPATHAPAVVLALLPWLATWGKGLVDNALAAAGTNAATVGTAVLANNNILYPGLLALDQGALLTSMILGAIGAFVVDQKFQEATVVAVTGAVFAFVGLVHAPKLAWNAAPGAMLGYLFLAGLIWLFGTYKLPAATGAREMRKAAGD